MKGYSQLLWAFNMQEAGLVLRATGQKQHSHQGLSHGLTLPCSAAGVSRSGRAIANVFLEKPALRSEMMSAPSQYPLKIQVTSSFSMKAWGFAALANF